MYFIWNVQCWVKNLALELIAHIFKLRQFCMKTDLWLLLKKTGHSVNSEPNVSWHQLAGVELLLLSLNWATHSKVFYKPHPLIMAFPILNHVLSYGCPLYSFMFPIWWHRMLLLLLLSRFSHVRLCATPEMAAHQAPPSLGFSRQKHWSRLPFPSPMHDSEKWKWSRSVVSNS